MPAVLHALPLRAPVFAPSRIRALLPRAHDLQQPAGDQGGWREGKGEESAATKEAEGGDDAHSRARRAFLRRALKQASTPVPAASALASSRTGALLEIARTPPLLRRLGAVVSGYMHPERRTLCAMHDEIVCES
jgi:hypothetical protein